MQFHAGELFESTLVGRSAENGTDPIHLAEPEASPRLIHRIVDGVFVNDSFAPALLVGVPDDGTELLALDSDGADLWAVGGGAASGPSAPSGGAVERPPLAARLVGGEFQELPLGGAPFGAADRLSDVAAIPGGEDAFATVVPFTERRSVNSKATVARIEPDGTTSTVRLPLAGSGRGSAARIACPGPEDCWLVTWAGWIFHYGDGAPLPRDTDPSFQGTIEFRPNESAEQFIPDRLPVDDSQLFAPPPLELDPTAPPRPARVRRLPPLLKQVRSRLHGLVLTVRFTATRRVRVQLEALRGGRVVARTPRRTFPPGRHRLRLRLSRDRYPTRLGFKVRVVKR
jgi:hypothetical protein